MTVWVDVTTSYTWNRPAVGIVRVELELLRHIVSFEENIRFFRYDNDICQFIEVQKNEVSSVVDRITSGNSHHISNNYTENKVEQRKRKFISIRKNEAKHFLVQTLVNSLYFFLSFIDQSYHFSVKNRLNNVKARLKRLFSFMKKRISSRRVAKVDTGSEQSTTFNDVNDNFFGLNDKVISVGAVWNYININNDFYKQKKNRNLEVFSISYDLIPIFKPHLCLDSVSGFFPGFYNDVCWYSDHIFCISESTKLDLLNFIDISGVPEPSLSVVTLGSDIPDSRLIDNDALELMVDRIGDYVLFVSTIERRKNHELIYKVITRWIDLGIDDFPTFVFVGMPGWGTQDLMKDIACDPRIKGKIHILNNMSDNELAYLYEHSLFTVYPSLYEGWGLPIAESLTYGKFCIASNTSSMPEAGAGLIELIEPLDVVRWSDSILGYYMDRADLAEKELAIKQQYSRPQWSTLADDIINKVLGKNL